MGMLSAITYWVFLPETWVLLALVLICADILLAFDFFVLSIGIAALILAGLLFMQRNLWLGDIILFQTWRDIAFWFAGLSIGSTILVRLILQRRHVDSDINEY